MLGQVNYLAVILGGVAAMVLGAIWYSMGVFGKPWMKLVGLTQRDMEASKKDMPKTYGTMFVGALVTAYVLANFVSMAHAMGAVSGAMIGFWAWLGFVATVMLSNVLFNKSPLQLYYINAGYQLLTLVVMGAILGVMHP